MRLNKVGKQIIKVLDALDDAQHELFISRACMPDLQGRHSDVSSSIKSAEKAIEKIKEAVEAMKAI